MARKGEKVRIGTSAIGRHAQGFTLIELIVVLAIMVGLAAAFPLARDRFDPARAVSVYASRTLNDLRALRAQAMRRQHRSSLIIDADGHGYRLVPDGTSHALPQALTLRITSADALSVQADAVTFFPDGSSSGESLVMTRAAFSVRLRVSPFTGRATLE